MRLRQVGAMTLSHNDWKRISIAGWGAPSGVAVSLAGGYSSPQSRSCGSLTSFVGRARTDDPVALRELEKLA